MLAQQQHITPEQAAQRLLKEGAQLHLQPSPAEQMWGAFSSPEDRDMLDDIVEEAYERRAADQPRDFGV